MNDYPNGETNVEDLANVRRKETLRNISFLEFLQSHFNNFNKQYKRRKHYRKQIKQIQEICHFNFI